MPFVSRAPKQIPFVFLLLLVPILQGCGGPKNQPFSQPTPMSSTLSQTVEGVTVSINVSNADAHRVVFDLTLEGPARPYGYALEITWIYEPQMPGPALTAGGKKLPFIAGPDMISGAQTPDGLPLFSRGIIGFDTSDLHWDQPRIPLHLSLPLLVNNDPPVPLPSPVPTGTRPPTGTPTQVPPASHVITFDFTFDVAYDDRQIVLEPHQEVESNGVKVTLERIDITASEARALIRYSSTTPDGLIYQNNWISYSDLKVGPLVGPEGQETVFTLVGDPDACYGSTIDDNQCIFSYVDRTLSLIDRAPIDCTLTVVTGPNEQRHVQGGNYPSTPGSNMVFRFTLPTSPAK